MMHLLARGLRALLLTALLTWPAAGLLPASAPDRPPGARFIVEAASAEAAAAAVTAAGGQPLRPLALIGAVEAELSPAAAARLAARGLAVTPNRPVAVAQAPGRAPGHHKVGHGETDTGGHILYPSAALGAHRLHGLRVAGRETLCRNGRVTVGDGVVQQRLRGAGVTVAVVDSGLVELAGGAWGRPEGDGTLIAEDDGRCVIYRNFIAEEAGKGGRRGNSADDNGHGTHVAATIVDRREVSLAEGLAPSPVGVAPDANLLVARAIGADGSGTYADVIAAIDWVVSVRERFNVRVLNLSLYAPVSAPYWADPLGRAAMRAWQAGIVVVAAAGNGGPAAGTITSPGNVPYVITVGSVMSGRYSLDGADTLAGYSSRGPTESAFVKPDLVVPGSRTIAPMPRGAALAGTIDELARRRGCQSGGGNPGPVQIGLPSYCWWESDRVELGVANTADAVAYYQLSGTSMATAGVSGLAALMLQASPGLTNDQVKLRLMATARPAIDPATGQPAYSVWEQGAGLVDAEAALADRSFAIANAGMDIALDLQTFTDGRTEYHYWGDTIWDEASGEFRLLDAQGQVIHAWAGQLAVFSGANRAWAGANRAWAGGLQAWEGSIKDWPGGLMAWSGANRAWAGANRAWAGGDPPTAASAASAEMIVDDQSGPRQLYMPLIRR